jgi:hypothetical protein
MAATSPAVEEPGENRSDELIPLTRNEIRRLFTFLNIRTVHSIEDITHWSRWRRRHQARAKTARYRRQAMLTLGPV